MINLMVLFKIAWTFLFGTTAGAMAHLPAALLGLAICDAVIVYVMRRARARLQHRDVRPGEHHA